ncbi:phospholipase D/Transphosphatidylase [Desulfurobacterium thermolithotrophum DSM 11699]|uniref:phospholipase D n=1 Tax=Desulfurobacterium thermolithotrophum (strain DSM 11699 / BSA) TaxID=868864 RepID=F0S311_DESTD|nr:phospholipase D family protein [Desulfurobacterium thermolithotrophum]ADY73233.1 phospholipase D/Transphosphatidylase [Desulfurobacterium thermolithotrophum DSM 11699]
MRVLALLLLLFSLFFSSCQQSETKGVITKEAATITPYFSPRGGCTSAIISEIEHARDYIDVAVFSFTSKPIARALIKAHKKGVKVRVIIDQGTARARNCVGPILEAEGIPVRYKRGSGGGLMHNKYAVIDGKTLITGSFNWTRSAEKRNDENLVVIKNANEVIKAYKDNFEKLWKLAGLTN